MIRKIVVCGLGKLGAPMSAVLAEAGFDVTGYDLDEYKVAAINAGRSPVIEPGAGDLISSNVKARRLCATSEPRLAVRGSDACVFITPTPSLPDGSFDNRFLVVALGTIAREVNLYERKTPYLFIVASTVNPRSCDRMLIPAIRHYLQGAFHFIYKPELIAIGSVVRDLQEPDFYLMGESSPAAGDAASEIYSVVNAGVPIKRMSLVEAELAKISLNCFVVSKIAFANQLAMVAEKFDADPHVILDAIGTDRRIGHKALRPGLPPGGPCFPRDARMFARAASKVGCTVPLCTSADIVNDRVIDWIALKALGHGGNIGILGTAYKPGTTLTDESPGLRIAELLQSRPVKTFDPMAEHSHSFEEVASCPILIVATAWPEFEEIPSIEGQVIIDPMQVVKRRIVKLKRRESEKVTN